MMNDFIKSNPGPNSGGPDADPQEVMLGSAPESARWNPLPGSTGHKAPMASSEDEDDEGRSTNETLVETGIADAAKDQSVQAANAGAKMNYE